MIHTPSVPLVSVGGLYGSAPWNFWNFLRADTEPCLSFIAVLQIQIMAMHHRGGVPHLQRQLCHVLAQGQPIAGKAVPEGVRAPRNAAGFYPSRSWFIDGRGGDDEPRFIFPVREERARGISEWCESPTSVLCDVGRDINYTLAPVDVLPLGPRLVTLVTRVGLALLRANPAEGPKHDERQPLLFDYSQHIQQTLREIGRAA